MRKLLLLLCLVPAFAFSQEPEFIGEVNIQKEDGSYTLLEKQYACTTSSADVGVYLIGFGNIRSKFIIQGRSSDIRLNKGKNVKLIVKSADNNYDPISTVAIFKFKNNKNERQSELSSMNILGDDKDYSLNTIKYHAKKSYTNCYEITIDNLEDGEYGIVQFNPRQSNERLIVVSCFGIGNGKETKKYYQ